MSDAKNNPFASRQGGRYEEEVSGSGAAVAEAPANGAAPRNGKQVTSWDAYRTWLTKVQAPEQRRSLPDPALFSFKGYRSWAEKVRRDWEYEE